ncbi:MAG: FAD:protein FMN transferase [Chitinispirillaceae bacterium]|nr:FAD:protein FMN transferase [Chitinispirillaceae bacterium]
MPLRVRARGLSSTPSVNRTAVMGTVACQEVYGISGEATAEAVNQELRRLDALWSPFRPGNIVDAIRNAAGTVPVSVDDDTFEILSMARILGIRSHGTFDITADPVIRLWRDAARAKKSPPVEQIEKMCNLVDIADLRIGTDRKVFLPRAGQGIDLGAIGKGYAADRTRVIYESAGIRHAVITIGGNVLVMSTRPDGAQWRIGIQDPRLPRNELFGYIEAENCSIVTSGDYERFFEYSGADGNLQRFHHIIDPRTGRPADTGVCGVTVMAASSSLADALATAAFILGIEKGMELCDSFEDIHTLFIDKKGLVHPSSGMRERFRRIANE